MVNILRTIVLNLVAVVCALPILISLVDLWTLIMFDYELIINWDQKKFTGAIMLAGISFVAKITDIWARA